MARLGLKLFHLRTRERRSSQQQVADALHMRQATLSNIERGNSLPSSELLLTLCRYYDVTPTWLLDDERSLEPRRTERWRQRNALVTAGMYIESGSDHAITLDDGKRLLQLNATHSFYDEEAAAIRQANAAVQGHSEALHRLFQDRTEADQALERELEQELKLHPRRRPNRQAIGPQERPPNGPKQNGKA